MTKRKPKSPAFKAIHSSASALRKAGAISEATMRDLGVMDAKKRKRLEKAGWEIGDAADFLATFPSPPQVRKTRITIRLDADVIAWFREQVNHSGGGSYQALMNGALRDFVDAQAAPSRYSPHTAAPSPKPRPSPRKHR